MAKSISFPAPKEYSVPEGTLDDQTFDDSATFKLNGDRLTLVAINGTPMPGFEGDKEEGRKSGTDEAAEASGLQARFQQAMMQQPA